MNLYRRMTKCLVAATLTLLCTPAFAGIFISIGIAPPPLPVYEQPACPDDGYIWVPGYWAYGDYGYFWVPGTWVQPPQYGLLWTPGYWGWGNGAFYFHSGYWGPHVGFYGGVNYGFGYGGNGYGGGRWEGGHFAYNTAVNNVNVTNIHNTYVDKTVIINVTRVTNVSYNGGAGGVAAQPTEQEKQYAHEQHVKPTAVQTAHVHAAFKDRSQLASVNGGKPKTLAAPRPDAYKRIALENAKTHPLTKEDAVKVPHPKTVTSNAQVEEKKTYSGSSSFTPEKKPSQTQGEEKKAPPKSPTTESHTAPAQHPEAKPDVKPAEHSDKEQPKKEQPKNGQ